MTDSVAPSGAGDVETTQATGHAEREAAITMIDRTVRRDGATVGADRGYDVEDFVDQLDRRSIKAHVARKRTGSAVDGRTARGKMGFGEQWNSEPA